MNSWFPVLYIQLTFITNNRNLQTDKINQSSTVSLCFVIWLVIKKKYFTSFNHVYNSTQLECAKENHTSSYFIYPNLIVFHEQLFLWHFFKMLASEESKEITPSLVQKPQKMLMAPPPHTSIKWPLSYYYHCFLINESINITPWWGITLAGTE